MNELILKEAIGAIKGILGTWKSEKHGLVSVKYDAAEEALAYHLSRVEKWSHQISHRDLPRSRFLMETFIKVQIGERAPERVGEVFEPDHLLESGIHSIVLGHPGAGKTTIIKYLCQHLLHGATAENENFAFPVRVLFRDLREGETLVDHVLNILKIEVMFDKSFDDSLRGEAVAKARRIDESELRDTELQLYHDRRAQEKARVLTEYLDFSRVILLLDGLDELSPEQGIRVQREVRQLANSLSNAKFVLTCRTGSLSVAVDNSETLYVHPFDSSQVRDFAILWLGSDAAAEAFLEAVARSPYSDTIGRPLILVNLCMVYQAYGELPDQPVQIYQKVVQLLLEKWDRENDLQRVSRYGRFGSPRKQQFLGALAFRLSSISRVSSKYSEPEIKRAYESIHSAFGLPLSQLEQVVEEIESHTGLLLSLGLGWFEFSHKSLQEYLCADHISRLPNLKAHLGTLFNLPNECAIATVLSSSPEDFVTFLAYRFIEGREVPGLAQNQLLAFWIPYLTRLRVEKASFAQSEPFGFSILFIASLAWRPENNRIAEGGDVLISIIKNLLCNEPVYDSVRQACSAFSVDKVGEHYASLKMTFPPRYALPQGTHVGNRKILIHSDMVRDLRLV